MKYRANNHVVALLITLVIVTIGIVKNEILSPKILNNEKQKEMLALNVDTQDEISSIENFINENKEIFEFYADTFAIDINDLEEQLILSNVDKVFNANNIAGNEKLYESLDMNIIDYLYNLENQKPELFNKKTVKNNKSREYIYNLLNYYCGIYEVDYQILASIAYIESGNLKAKTMLNKNNIYGGMADAKTLISYRNISYGVLSYVKLMKNKYFNNGLDTVEKIGIVFNPVITNGHKQANPKWLNNVNSVLSKFDNIITINNINDLDSDI